MERYEKKFTEGYNKTKVVNKKVKTKWGSYVIIASGEFTPKEGAYSCEINISIYDNNDRQVTGWNLEEYYFYWEDYYEELETFAAGKKERVASHKEAENSGIKWLKNNVKKYI